MSKTTRAAPSRETETLELEWEIDGYVSRPIDRDVMPLCDFPLEDQRRIAVAALSPERPEKWLYFAYCRMESRAWYEWHWHRGINPDKIRPRLAQYLRQMVIDRDGYVCGLCGGPVETDDVHIDHIHPWSLGGSDALDNLQVAHSSCNIQKGNRV